MSLFFILDEETSDFSNNMQFLHRKSVGNERSQKDEKQLLFSLCLNILKRGRDRK